MIFIKYKSIKEKLFVMVSDVINSGCPFKLGKHVIQSKPIIESVTWNSSTAFEANATQSLVENPSSQGNVVIICRFC